MTIKKNVYVVLDTETSGFSKLVFDLGWISRDKKGNVIDSASYLMLDVIATEKPYFIHKVKGYTSKARKSDKFKLSNFATVRRLFNAHIKSLLDANYRVIICAYNARFDCDALAKTTKRMTKESSFLTHKNVELMDIWGNWVNSSPKSYTAPLTASKKWFSSSAENAYRFEYQEPNFIEQHTALEDCKVETKILDKVLARKKKLKIVKSPKQFESFWSFNSKLEVA
tara:strand:- start:515 stop:1192 length:678 start_codon:yes stop_codon:yes gene_type:complete